MFRNVVSQTFDPARGQVSVPASFIKVIKAGDPEWVEGRKPRFIVLFSDHLEGCLEGYTMAAAADYSERILSMPEGSEAREMLELLFFTQSYEAEVQPDGRIVIPKERREAIGLTDRAVFAGLGNRFRIWHPDAYERAEAERRQRLREQRPALRDPFSLLPPRKGG